MHHKQDKNKAKLSRIAFGMNEEDYETKFYLPAQIFGFFESISEETEGEIFALVKFLDENSVKKTSVLTTEWKAKEFGETQYGCVDVDAFVCHSLIVPSDKTLMTFIKVLPPELWAEQFHDDE